MSENIDSKEKMKNMIHQCSSLIEKLETCSDLENKIMVLQGSIDHIPEYLKKYFEGLSAEETFAVLTVFAIGQGARVFNQEAPFDETVASLLKVEKFYNTIGGIIGYHQSILRLILQDDESQSKANYHQPRPYDILNLTPEVWSSIRDGIESLPQLGEMFPVGGAGDRLQLRDGETREPLPAAALNFCGRSLMEGIIRDVQAKEFLYCRLHNQQLIIPIALMTSEDIHNHDYILEIFESSNWFHRSKESYRFFKQPLVPVISEAGYWILEDSHHLTLKPGGHGVIWKQASDEGVFDWFEDKGCTKLLIRQVNNPVACTDYGVIATIGYGVKEQKSFGVASCRRRVHAAEGMNVLCEKEVSDGVEYGITNIEYTEFQKKGIDDVPVRQGSQYSAFPANTNILFVDIESIKDVLPRCPIPGMLVNMKSKFGNVIGGRLESTMQNIADAMSDHFPEKIDVTKQPPLKTFLTYNRRRKTLSVTKNSYQQGKGIEGTPLGGYYEMLQNYFELFTDYCKIDMPELPDEKEYVKYGPSFVVNFHPALGPLWEIVGQKISGGSFSKNSELQLEIAEVDIKNLNLRGSLLVEAKDLLGMKNPNGEIQYSQNCGKCSLHNVVVENRGIDRSVENTFWMNKIQRNAALRIVLHGNAEFYAADLTLEGDHFIEVPHGYKVIASEKDGQIHFEKEVIKNPSWSWQYEYNEANHIILNKQSS